MERRVAITATAATTDPIMVSLPNQAALSVYIDLLKKYLRTEMTADEHRSTSFFFGRIDDVVLDDGCVTLLIVISGNNGTRNYQKTLDLRVGKKAISRILRSLSAELVDNLRHGQTYDWFKANARRAHPGQTGLTVSHKDAIAQLLEINPKKDVEERLKGFRQRWG